MLSNNDSKVLFCPGVELLTYLIFYYIFYILYRCEQKWRKFSEVKSFSANAWTTLKLFLCKFFGPGQFSVRSKNMNLKNLWPILKEMLIPFPRTWHFYWVLVEKHSFYNFLYNFMFQCLNLITFWRIFCESCCE